jgi:surfactin synthase thioesterase subunit
VKARTRQYFWTNAFAPEGLNLTCKPCMKADLLERYRLMQSAELTAGIRALLGKKDAA